MGGRTVDDDGGAPTPLTELADRALTEPHPHRLPHDHPARAEILHRHDDALGRGLAGYVYPVTGLFVMAATTLAARGRCCGRGCRHCPYVV